MFCFWIAVNAMAAHCFFSIREVTSVAMADVTPDCFNWRLATEAQELMTTCEGAMAAISCVDTGSEAQRHSEIQGGWL
jgi:hypothetical protein